MKFKDGFIFGLGFYTAKFVINACNEILLESGLPQKAFEKTRNLADRVKSKNKVESEINDHKIGFDISSCKKD